MKQTKLKAGPLLDGRGRLIESGYHTSLIKTYEKKYVRNKRFRLKEWDYYYVGNDDYGIALTVADNGYMWILSATLLDFKSKNEYAKTKMGIPIRRFKMPQTSATGDIIIKKGNWDMAFKHEGKLRHLEVEIKNFKGNIPLQVDLYLEPMVEDSMVIVTPFEKQTKFYYNQKINLLRSSGVVQLGEEIFDFNDCFGVLDWGRGSWTYHNIWYWSSMSGLSKGHYLGFNLGYGFGDNSKATENMLFYDKKTYKLNDVMFNIPKTQDTYDYLEPWIINSKDKMIDLTFTPVYDRTSYSSALIIKSDQHQVFGYFNGTFTINKEIITIEDMFGFAERVENKW